MASKFPLVRTLAKRTYAVAAVENQVLSNNLTVASAPSNLKGLCKVALVVRAGSRYETMDNYGASHLLRASLGLTTADASSFSIIKNLGKLGATMSATSDRETLVYTLNATCDQLDDALKYFKAAVAKQEFRPWELSEVYPRLKYELAIRPPTSLVLDLVHKAAYRTGLGNSIYAKEYQLKKLCPETLKHYVNSRFQTSKMAVVGVGVDQSTLTSFAESLGFQTQGGSSSTPSTYHGGEVREDANTPLAYVVLVGEGAALNKKEVFTYGVLRYALGGGCSIKRGVGSNPLSKVVSKSFDATHAQAVNFSHSDSGLFGLFLATTPENTKEAVTGAMKALKDGVTEADVNRAKSQLKAQALYESESDDGVLTDLANQAVLLGGGKNASSLVSEIDSVTTSQVEEALKKFLNGKKSLAAYGNIANVPYLDEF
ncbi:cytochrome b-c1 complex subunit 2, mitochondrial [Cimex lectularius]|uniref:Cytochrome b-c1 complex subunit 2, mitochondrial n=1 Tax=Cimex lectularius TaxID=79782 RepID=A0A8I6TGJ7_CIMLE|nr:cytochrome b-c1 complex subunit 2, mitochondrial [Cimex lectularius]